MEIATIYDEYTEKISQIQLYQRTVKENTEREHAAIIEDAQNFLKKYPDKEEFLSSIHNMYFYRANDGKIQSYGQKISDTKQRELNLILHKNKQYLWLLAEAYEEFEDFLEKVYAYVGYTDRALWLLKDFCSITLSELEGKDYNWFLEQSKNKKDVPKSILNFFSNNFQPIKSIEQSNALKINLRLAVILIEKLRHVIVHNGGIVGNRVSFIKQVLKDAGLFNNGNYRQEYKKFIEQFFGSNSFQNHISLLEIKRNQYTVFDVHVNIFDMLSGYLLAYSYELFKEIEKI